MDISVRHRILDLFLSMWVTSVGGADVKGEHGVGRAFTEKVCTHESGVGGEESWPHECGRGVFGGSRYSSLCYCNAYADRMSHVCIAPIGAR